jgi:hypothetical protein
MPNWRGLRGGRSGAGGKHVPPDCLSTVLARIADHPINKIDELLPWKLDLPKSSSNPAAA